MNFSHFFASTSLLTLFLVTVLVACLPFEIGFQFGKYRFQRSEKSKDVPIGSMIGSTFGLLAFMLAFTFGMAASHFDARKQAVLSDANAIRSTYHMAGLLPVSRATEVKKLLREYVDLRLEAFRSPKKLDPLLARSEEIHDLLLKEAVANESSTAATSASWLFVQSVDAMINTAYARLSVASNVRVPATIWLVLYAILFFSMLAAGYNSGLVGGRGTFVFIILCITFSLVLILIADLDRPKQGLFRISQQSLENLQKKMSADKL